MLHTHMPYEEFCIMSANNFLLPVINNYCSLLSSVLAIMSTLYIIILLFIFHKHWRKMFTLFLSTLQRASLLLKVVMLCTLYGNQSVGLNCTSYNFWRIIKVFLMQQPKKLFLILA